MERHTSSQPGEDTSECQARDARGDELQDFIDNLNAPVAKMATDGTILEVGSASAAHSGLSREDVLGRKLWEVPWWSYSPEGQISARNAVLSAASGQTVRDEVSRKMSDGSTATLVFTVRPVFGDDGSIKYLVGEAHDITDRKRVEDALRRSEERYKELVQNSNSIILRWDRNGNVKFMNDFGLRFFRYSEDEIVGRNVVGTIVPETDTSGRDLVALMRDITHEPERHESNVNENMLRDGTRVWIAWTNKPVFDEQGRMTEILSVGVDVTERKKTEEALKSSEQRLADIIDFLPDATWVVNVDGAVTGWNRAAEKLTGVKSKDIVGKSNYEIGFVFYGERRPVLVDLVHSKKSPEELGYHRVKMQDGSLQAEMFIPNLGASGMYLWGKASPLHGPDGKLLGAIESIRDVTDRVRAEQRILEEKRLSEKIISAVPGIFYMLDRDAKLIWRNNQLNELLYLEPSEDNMPNLLLSVVEEDRKSTVDAIEAVYEEGQASIEIGIRHKDGSVHDYYCTGTLVEVRDMLVLIGVGIDITDRKQAEAEKRVFYREAIRSVTQGKLDLVSRDEVETHTKTAMCMSPITSFEDTVEVREKVERFLCSKGLSGDDLSLFITGLGEAMTNALKHADKGEVYAGVDANGVWVAVSDEGPGIETLTLPGATLRRGFSTKISMGMGYTIMLEASDSVLLCTGRTGTTVVLTKDTAKPKPAMSLDDLPDTWDQVPNV